MDLSKAKTVLIIAFLLLNIFLGYQLWQQGGVSPASSLHRDGELNRLEAAMEEAGMTMEISLPRGAMRLSHLSVEPIKLPRQELLNFFFPTPEELVVQRVDEHLHYHQESRYLSIDPTGLITFRMEEDQNEIEITREEALEAASNFFNYIDHQGKIIDDYQHPHKGGWILYYLQEFNDFPIYSSHLHITIAGDRITGVEVYLLRPLEFSGQEREIIPVSTALLRLLEEHGQTVAGTEIVELNLGFYSPKYVAERWEIPPVWRIRLNSGEVYYVNAFTGHLEGH